jgi:hypothetical protein
MLGIWGFAYYRLLWNLADEVLDGGDHLVVRLRGEQQRIPLGDVINIAFERRQNGRRVVLRLARPGPFGDRIVFKPPVRFLPTFSTDPLEDDLIRRVDAARRKVAA